MDSPHPVALTRRTLGLLAAGLMPGAGTAAAPVQLDAARQREFVSDLTKSLELQLTALDMADVHEVFARLKNPALTVCTGRMAVQTTMGALAAAREQGAGCAVALVLCAFAPGEARLDELKAVFDAARARLDPNVFLIFGACRDDQLDPGTLRVSALTG